MSAYYGQLPAATLPQAYGRTLSYVVKGYTGTQLRSASGATASGLTGAGVRVAVIDAYDSPTLLADTTRYAAAHGDVPYAAGQLAREDAPVWTHTAPSTPSTPDGCGASGWYGEQTLDIEALNAMAPAAGTTYLGVASCADADLVDALNKITDRHLADIVSDSWGEPETASDPAMDPVYDQIFQTGALEGIGFYFSSGDSGDEFAATGTKQTGMPASLSWVTAVGGTSLGVGPDGEYQFETGWGTDKALLSPTGPTWAAQPAYQRPVVPLSLALVGGAPHRAVPDIAAVADSSTGFLIGQTQTFPNGTTVYSRVLDRRHEPGRPRDRGHPGAGAAALRQAPRLRQSGHLRALRNPGAARRHRHPVRPGCAVGGGPGGLHEQRRRDAGHGDLAAHLGPGLLAAHDAGIRRRHRRGIARRGLTRLLRPAGRRGGWR
jgi:subtilase family serine protease